MFVSLLLGVGLLLILALAVRAFAGADPKRLLGLGKGLAIGLIVAVAVFLAATGRLSLVIGMAVLLAPFLARLWRQGQWAKLAARMAGPGGGPRTSTIETKTLRMTLDHGSGDLDGEVLAGPAAGRRLSDLDRDALADLLRQCAAADRASLAVLEAFLDRRHPDWRETMAAAGTPGADAGRDGGGGEAGSGGDGGAMSRAQAYRILGLAPGADDEAVREAHHRLIALVHPDRGGSGFLAAQVNRARDVLLGRGRS